MDHVAIFLASFIICVGFVLGVTRQQSKKFIELDEKNTDIQRQLDDLKRELEELKRKE
jgi:hypothetical protein